MEARPAWKYPVSATRRSNQPPEGPNQPPQRPNQPPGSPNQPPGSPNQPPGSRNAPPRHASPKATTVRRFATRTSPIPVTVDTFETRRRHASPKDSSAFRDQDPPDPEGQRCRNACWMFACFFLGFRTFHNLLLGSYGRCVFMWTHMWKITVGQTQKNFAAATWTENFEQGWSA